jgi:hypothetical protein
VLATGIPGTAVIAGVEQMGHRDQRRAQCRITVNVSLPERPLCQAPTGTQNAYSALDQCAESAPTR